MTKKELEKELAATKKRSKLFARAVLELMESSLIGTHTDELFLAMSKVELSLVLMAKQEVDDGFETTGGWFLGNSAIRRLAILANRLCK